MQHHAAGAAPLRARLCADNWFSTIPASRENGTAFDKGLQFGAWYGNFDIILGHLSRVSQLHPTPHAPCAMLYLVTMLAVC